MPIEDLEKSASILKKYQNGDPIAYEDNELIESLSSMGFVTKGVSLKYSKITAKTSTSGEDLIGFFK